MTFTTAVRSVLSKYVTFSGRAMRSEYWWWTLFAFLVALVTSIVDGVVVAPMLGYEPFSEDAIEPLSALVSLALFLPGLAVGVRRLHDLDKSGWWMLIVLIPLIGIIVLIYWFVHRGTDGPNRFGDSPLPPAAGAGATSGS
jgi:uncharacterized membrane protein YhaH (DUF805 family)